MCYLNTESKSNGNTVCKVLKFNVDGTWSLEVCGKVIDLNKCYIENKYSITRESIQTICKIVLTIKLCQGMEVQKSMIVSRYYIIEQ